MDVERLGELRNGLDQLASPVAAVKKRCGPGLADAVGFDDLARFAEAPPALRQLRPDLAESRMQPDGSRAAKAARSSAMLRSVSSRISRLNVIDIPYLGVAGRDCEQSSTPVEKNRKTIRRKS